MEAVLLGLAEPGVLAAAEELRLAVAPLGAAVLVAQQAQQAPGLGLGVPEEGQEEAEVVVLRSRVAASRFEAGYPGQP